MAEDETTLVVLLVVAVAAVIGLGLSLSSFATDRAMMGNGGMMSGGGGTSGSVTGPGPLEWVVLILSVVFFGAAVILLVMRTRGRQDAVAVPASAAPVAAAAAVPGAVPATALVAEPQVPAPAAATPAPIASVPEPTLVRLLNEDERRMYLELRDHGGTMYQRDLVALGIFSKAKVTRVLDKLEAKGLVVREAHGMTNRVRLVVGPTR